MYTFYSSIVRLARAKDRPRVDWGRMNEWKKAQQKNELCLMIFQTPTKSYKIIPNTVSPPGHSEIMFL